MITIDKAIRAAQDITGFRKQQERETPKYQYTEVLMLAEEVGRQMTRYFVLDTENTFAYTQMAKWLAAASETGGRAAGGLV